jgi:hypothetical protein
MPSPTLQFKRGLFANLPGLKAGEPGFTTDFFELYVGIDSTTTNNKFFGSHRYWSKGSASTGSGVNLVEGTSNGSDFITLKAPDTLAGITTYTFPAAPINNNVLATDTNGVLSWVASVNEFSIGTLVSGIGTFSNNVAFTTTTDNTLGNENTGAVQLDGGMGIAKNLTVKENLSVGTNLGIGTTTPTSKLWVNGDGYFVGVITANKFVGALDATFALAQSVGFATTATNLAGGTTGNVPYQSNAGITTFVTNPGVSGKVLLFNGSIPVWGDVSAASGSFGGISVQDESSPVGTSGSITTLNFVGANIRAIATTGASGIATITIADNLVGVALSISGISTFTNGPVLIGGETSTGTVGQVLQVAGINSSVYVGGNLGVGVTNPTSKLSVDGGINVTGDLNVDGGDVTSSTAALNLFNTNVTNANVLGAGTNIVIGATSGIATINNPTVVGTQVTQNLYNTVATNLNFAGAATALVIGATSGITTVRNDLTVAGDLRINGNDIKASDGNTNITLTSNTLTTFAGDIKVTGNDILASDNTVAITLSGADVTVAGDLKVGGNDIEASDGTTAITLSAVTGNVGVSSDLTVGGNLYVNGSTTQVNTAALTVEDRTIDLGIVSGDAPGAPTTWDLGILFNYHATTAKKSAVIWEHADARFKFASILDADTNGSTAVTPQLTVNTFAPIEIGQLWVNDCAGSSQVISCTGTTRNLINITIDAGEFV